MSRRKQSPSELPRPWVIWTFWPLLVVMTSVLPVMVAVMAGSSGRVGQPTIFDALAAIGEWAMPMYADGLAAIGVVATVLVAVAAATGFSGNWASLERRAHPTVAAALTVSLAIVGAPSTFALPVVFADPRQLPRVLLVLGCGWLTALAGASVFQISTPAQRARERGRTWRKRRKRAAGFGVSVDDHVALDAVRWSTAAIWAAPLLLWVISGTTLLSIGIAPSPLRWSDVLLVVSLGAGSALLILTWRATADRSIARRTRKFVRLVGGTFAWLVALSSAVLVWSNPHTQLLAWGLVAFTAVHALAFFVPEIARRLPPLRIIEHAATVRGLRAVREDAGRSGSITRPRRLSPR